MHANQSPRFIYITGADGTGKTTQARLLLEKLKANGVDAGRLWLRFPFFFSLPLLAYARLRGFSWYEESGGYRHGYWDFRRSWLLRRVFPWVLLLDAALASLIKVYLPLRLGRTIVCERYVLDMLVDLSVAVGDDEFFRRKLARSFLDLIPSGAKIIVLTLEVEELKSRRGDLIFDKHIEKKSAAYQRLVRDLSMVSISSLDLVEDVSQSIWKAVVN